MSLSLVAVGCGDDKADDTSGDSDSTATTTTAAEAASDGVLAGMKGTTPLVDLGDDFKNRMKEIDPALVDFNYGAESYDATIIIALAAAEAKTDGAAYAEKINGITRGGEKCTDYKSCLEIINAGGDPDYDGASGPLEFSGNGEPTQASYGILQFGEEKNSEDGTACDKTKECLDDALTKFVKATAPESADVPQVPVTATREGDGELTIGTLLPITGSLAFLGPPEFAGFDLAIADINAAGGVLGKPVLGSKGDSGDATTDTVNQTTDRLLAENVDAIIGAASSGVSLKVIDKITGAGVVQFSPANTSKTLSTYNDKGLYFRTAPSDILQGQVLGELVAEDGNKNVAIINRNDAYGTGLAEDLTKALTEAGAKVVITKTYDEKADKFNAEVNEIKGQSPDAVVIIGFEESSKILSTMVEAGIGPKEIAVYGCDGNMGNALGESFDKGE